MHFVFLGFPFLFVFVHKNSEKSVTRYAAYDVSARVQFHVQLHFLLSPPLRYVRITTRNTTFCDSESRAPLPWWSAAVPVRLVALPLPSG